MTYDNLYEKLAPHTYCEGCSVLDKKKAKHCIQREVSTLPEGEEILFVSDSYKYKKGEFSEFSSQEIKTLVNSIPEDITTVSFLGAANCPGLTDKTLKPADQKLCRQHLIRNIHHMRPKLIFACGNLAMRLLTGKSGITKQRGNALSLGKPFLEADPSYTPVVVPIFHPFSVFNEPKNLYLFEVDIRNGINKYIKGISDEGKFDFIPILSIQDFINNMHILDTDVFAMDIESTGLNFRKHRLNTIAITTEHGTLAIPLNHKDSPFDEAELKIIYSELNSITSDPDLIKIFHNCKFDIKFLLKAGLEFRNVWDTKMMAHLLKEDRPKSLMDLVKEYYPGELESL